MGVGTATSYRSAIYYVIKFDNTWELRRLNGFGCIEPMVTYPGELLWRILGYSGT